MADETMPTEAQLRFYYTGLYTVLLRYRRMTMLGWAIALIGVVSIPLGWRFGTPHGLIDVLLSAATIVAGLALVQQSVASLTSYLHVPFMENAAVPQQIHPAVQRIEDLMDDMDEGGWQEAFAAIRELKSMETKYGLPPLGR